MVRTDVRRLMRFQVSFAVVVGFFFCLVCAADALQFSEMVPTYGDVGTEVVLYGTGLDSEETYEVALGGLSCSVTALTSEAITFTVPANAATGDVSVTLNSVTTTHWVPFTVLRSVSVTWDPPPQVSSAGYTLGTVYDEHALRSVGPVQVGVPDVGPVPVIAARLDEDPVFLAIATSQDTAVTIDAASTAAALVFLSPPVAERDDESSADALAVIAALPETSALAVLITDVSADGVDYQDDSRVSDATVAAVEAYFAARIAAEPREAGARDTVDTTLGQSNLPSIRYRKVSADYPNKVWLRPTFQAGVQVGDETYVQLTQTIDPGTGWVDDRTKLDWLLYVYRIDPDDFPQGVADVNDLEWYEASTRLSEQPVAKGYLMSNMASKDIDVVDRLGSFVGGLLNGEPEAGQGDGELLLPTDSPALYMVRSYSGNMFYASPALNNYTDQRTLMNALSDGKSNWRHSAAANVLIASLDATSTLMARLDTNSYTDAIRTVTGDVVKAISVMEEEGTMTEGALRQLVVSTAKALVDFLKSAALNTIASKGLFKTVLKQIDVIGRVSSGAQTVDRITAILGPGTLSVESTIIVVGEPFKPYLRSIDPASGPVGTEVTIRGYQLGAGDAEIFFGHPDNDVDAVQVPSDDVVTAGDWTLVVRVPEGAVSSNMYVRSPSGVSEQDFPFHVVQPLDGVSLIARPNTVIPEYVVGVDAGSFPLDANDQPYSFVHETVRDRLSVSFCLLGDGRPENWVEGTIENVNATSVTVRAPDTPGDYHLRFEIPNSQSQTANLTVALPDPETEQLSGESIQANDLSLNNIADDKMTLGEAMMLASGTLGRNITRHVEGEEEGTVREEDFISGDNVGLLYRDSISVDADFAGQVLVAAGGLPVPANGDSFDFSNITVNGAGAAVPAWPLYGTSFTSLANVTFTNFAGGGIVLSSSREVTPLYANTVNDVTLTNITGNALYLEGDAMANTFSDIIVDTVTGNGLHVTGGALLNSFERISILSVTGHGVYWGGGALVNDADEITVDGCGQNGVLFDQDAVANHMNRSLVTNATGNGLHMTGADVAYNEMSSEPYSPFEYHVFSSYSDNGEYGVRIDGGAHDNLVHPGRVWSNGSGGVLVQGASTEGNVIGRIADTVPQKSDIFYNTGPGVHLDNAGGTYLRYLGLAGNSGDGILLEGSDCAWNQVQSCQTSIDFSDTGAWATVPNQGSGIHIRDGAHDNLVGDIVPGSRGWRNEWIGNRDHGVLIEGATTFSNTVNQSHIGPVIWWNYGPYIPNGENGIVLRDGTHDNVIGDTHQWLDLHIDAHTNGAGILIEGEGTDGNLVVGCQIGVEHDSALGPGCKIGIHIRNGPQYNEIGIPGEYTPLFFDPPDSWENEDAYEFLFGNVLSNNTEAGLVLENCGAEITRDGDVVGGNRVVNNYIGCREDSISAAKNEAGIKLLAGATGNVIGGELAGDGNRIKYNRLAGVEFDGCSISDSRLTNCFANNVIQQSGYDQAAWSTSVLDGYEHGIGVLMHNGSDRCDVGDPNVAGNEITSNIVGVYIDGGNADAVQNNDLHDNALAGVVLRDCSECQVGGTAPGQGNIIWKNGSGGGDDGGVILSEGASNRVALNDIGVDSAGNLDKGNNGWGIILDESTDNVVGATVPASANNVVQNVSGGIRISGTGAVGNTLQGNFVGALRGDPRAFGNTGSGIRIEGGATLNLVGGSGTMALLGSGFGVPAPNTIANNGGAGVEVDGAGSTGNSILDNSITNNTGLGISLTNGGNSSIPAPRIIAWRENTVFGDVSDVVACPPDSIVQLFYDAAGEGETLLGESTVLADGSWVVETGFKAPVTTATLTHPTSGNTSEFGTPHDLLAALNVGLTPSRRSSSRSLILPGASRSGIVVLDLTLTAVNADVFVGVFVVHAAGTLNDPEHVTGVAVYRDVDDDGTVSDGDTLLGGGTGTTFADDDGEVLLDLSTFVQSGQSERWLVAVDFTTDTSVSGTFQASLPDADAVGATLGFPIAAVQPTATFPIESDVTTLIVFEDTDGDGMDDTWETTYLGNLAHGADGDLDDDGVSNLKEYETGGNPAAYTIVLVSGWNLISIGRVPDDNSVVGIFGTSVLSPVWGWDGVAYICVTRLLPLQGYWVYHPGSGVSVEVSVPVADSARTSRDDTDGDGMDDVWETAHFGDLDQPGYMDYDGDGFTNRQEYDCQSNPELYTLDLTPRWNLVSLARLPADNSVFAVFGRSILGPAFVWEAEGGYVTADTLTATRGHWVACGAPAAIDVGAKTSRQTPPD